MYWFESDLELGPLPCEFKDSCYEEECFKQVSFPTSLSSVRDAKLNFSLFQFHDRSLLSRHGLRRGDAQA